MISKYLDPKNNFAFRRLFGQEKNKDILIALLNSVLGNQFHQEIVEATFIPTSQDPEIAGSKQSIVDVLCQDQDGCQYIIEMQVAQDDYFKERAQYYAAKAFSQQLKKGEAYGQLKSIIFLAFTNYPIFPKKEEYKSEHITLDKHTYEHDLDKFSFTFVDLVKFDAQRPQDIGQLTLEEKFYYFLKHAPDTTPKALQKIIGQDKILQKAYQELDHFYWTESERTIYENQEKIERDHLSILNTAIRQGIEKGKKEGREEGLKQAILGMHRTDMDVPYIARALALAEEAVQKIIDQG